MEVNVKFLGEEYTFSTDIKEYVRISNLADSVHNSLIKSFESKLAKSEICCIETKDIDTELKNAAERFIKELCQKGVYSHTVDEYVKNNPALSLIDEINSAANKACRSFLIEEMENFKNGVETAESEAMAQITGSGVSVYSNSFLTLAASSAMEYSILKGQYKKADEQYKNRIQSISDYGENVRNSKEREFKKKDYIPNMDKALTLFSYALMDQYLKDLIAENKFDSNALNNVDYEKSMGVLKNLTHIDSVEGIISCIKQAFEICPFNHYVYLNAASTPSFDIDTFKAAEFFGVDKQFLSDLKANIHITNSNLNEDIEKYSPFIRSYAISMNISETALLKELTDSLYRNTISKYSKLQKMVSNKQSVEYHVSRMSQIQISNMNESDIKEHANRLVKDIISLDNYYALVEKCGYADLPNQIKAENYTGALHDKTEIDNFFVSSIYPVLREIILNKQNIQKEIKNDNIYSSAMNYMSDENNISGLEKALDSFTRIETWKDSADKIAWIKEQIPRLNANEEKQREIKLKRTRRNRIIAIIVSSAVLLSAVAAVIYVQIFIPNDKYNTAIGLINAGKYSEGYALLEELGDYSDVSDQKLACKYKEALSLQAKKSYDQAISIFTELGQYADSPNQITECKYLKAINLLENGKYDEALSDFIRISQYSDSKNKILQCHYEKGLSFYNSQDYDNAISEFTKSLDFSDAEEKIKACNYGIAMKYVSENDFSNAIKIYNKIDNYDGLLNSIQESCYKYALQLSQNQEWYNAYMNFKLIEDYRDSTEKMKELIPLDTVLTAINANVGDIIKLGEYEQDNIINTVNEPIEWIVLERTDTKILVVSKNCLFTRYYSSDSYRDICDWGKSSANEFLNDTFYTNAFNDKERGIIAGTNNSYTQISYNKDSFLSGYSTKRVSNFEKIFILSSNEITKLNEDTLTPQLTRSVYIRNTSIDGFLLRDIGNPEKYIDQVQIRYLNTDGDVVAKPLDKLSSSLRLGLRPAMWISINPD